MALSRITLPVSYYGSPVAGKPIPFGKIYIGLPDLNPRIEANRLPLVIIQEDGVEVNIAPNEQPLETNAGGYISYQGSVVEVRVDGDYSIAVDDQNDDQQYYFPKVFDAIDDQDAFYQAANFFENDPSSTSNAYVILSPNTPRQTQYIDGQLIVFRPSDPNSGASTIEIIGDAGGLGAKTATLGDGVSAIPDNFFSTLYDYYFRYDENLDVLRFSEIQIIASQLAPDAKLPPFHKTIEISNGTDTDNDIDIGVGFAKSIDNLFSMEVTAEFTKQMDANWAEGDNGGGFPSGLTRTDDTWYRLFLIAKPDGTVDAGFDTDADAANLLADAAGYNYYRRIGWVLNETAAIKEFFNNDDRFEWKERVLDVEYNGSFPTARTAFDTNCPPDTYGKFSIAGQRNTTGETYVIITETRGDDITPSKTDGFDMFLQKDAGFESEESNVSEIQRYVDSSSQIQGRGSAADIQYDQFSLGWRDYFRD